MTDGALGFTLSSRIHTSYPLLSEDGRYFYPASSTLRPRSFPRVRKDGSHGKTRGVPGRTRTLNSPVMSRTFYQLKYGNKCREHMLPFHMPLCSGVWCSPALPALPSSTGEVSGDLYPLGLGAYQLIRRFAFVCCLHPHSYSDRFRRWRILEKAISFCPRFFRVDSGFFPFLTIIIGPDYRGSSPGRHCSRTPIHSSDSTMQSHPDPTLLLPKEISTNRTGRSRTDSVSLYANEPYLFGDCPSHIPVPTVPHPDHPLMHRWSAHLLVGRIPIHGTSPSIIIF